MNQVSQSSIRSAALKYLALDLPIIPLCPPDHSGMALSHREKCKAPGKAPTLPNWTSLEVPKEKEVVEWFESNPKHNLGLILGDTGEYNLVGIDVDGESGEELLEEYSKGVLPPTWEFRTGKGRRLIYALPENALSKKHATKGEDGELAFLATGQQTVLPPSIHSNGTVYEWSSGSTPFDAELADAPQWLLNIILVQSEQAATHEMTVSVQDWNKQLSKGERNNHLTKLAGSLIARRNIPKEQVMAFLKQWNQQNCDPPLPEQEVESMVENLHEAEHLKAASMKRRKDQAKETLRPITFARHFTQKQEKEGISWRFCVEKGVFYKCDREVGPWKVADNIYLQKEIRKELVSIDPGFDSQRHVNEIMYAMKEYLAEPVNDDLFDIGKHPNVDSVYLANGTLEWRTLELKKWNPDSYSTIKLPVIWDPEANKTDAYEKWQKTLESWLPDEETRKFLQEFVGYCLVPDCSHRTAVFLYGGGSNGKSLFLEIVAKLFHGYISFVPLHWIGERFESSKLMDKLINVCGDIDSKYMTETSTLKAMIAGDPIRAEFKHGKSFHFHPVARLMFSANLLPRSSDKSEGWYSRWKYVEFPRRFKTDTNFKKDLLATMSTPEALSALVFWAVEGLRRLYDVTEFTVGEVMKKSEEQHRLENDTVQAFVSQLLHHVGHTGADTLVVIPSIYAVYRVWCDDFGVKQVSQHEFTRRFGALDVQKSVRQIRGGSANCFLGIKFNGYANESGYLEEYLFNESIRASGIKKRTGNKNQGRNLEVMEGDHPT